MAGASQEAMLLTEEYLNSLCSVKSMRDELLAAGRVRLIKPDLLEIEDPDGRLPVIGYGTTVKLSITSDRLPAYFGAGKVYVSTEEVLRVVEYVDINHYEQRKSFRVPIRLRGRGAIGGADMNDLERSFVLDVKDLSLTGLYFLAERDLVLGQKVRVVVNLPHDYFEFQCSVRRKERIDARRGYGCRFEDLSRPMADKLCGYLFKVQGEQIRRAKRR